MTTNAFAYNFHSILVLQHVVMNYELIGICFFFHAHLPDPSGGAENLSLQPQVFNISLRTLQKLKHRKPCLIPEIEGRDKDDIGNQAINS